MNDIAYRCPECGFVALKKEGCRYCYPNKEVNQEEAQVTSQEAGPAEKAEPTPVQLTLSLEE